MKSIESNKYKEFLVAKYFKQLLAIRLKNVKLIIKKFNENYPLLNDFPLNWIIV